jgi:hypothetical protein
MPMGPQRQKRPADAIGLALAVAKVATGEIEDNLQDKYVAFARAGGLKKRKARTAASGAEERIEKAGAAARRRKRGE